MKTPRNLKQSIENGYIIYNIYSKGNKRIRIDLKERFHQSDRKPHLSFWINRDYFKRNYPNSYESF